MESFHILSILEKIMANLLIITQILLKLPSILESVKNYI